MSMLKNFLNKFSKKKNQSHGLKDDDSTDKLEPSSVDEIIVEDYLENDNIAIESYELGDETVILDGIELGEELLPHESQEAAIIPKQDDLVFPELPKQKVDTQENRFKAETESDDQVEEITKDDEHSLNNDETGNIIIDDENSHDDTSSEILDLNENSISIRDKVEHLKIRVADKFRNFNTKKIKLPIKEGSHIRTKIHFNELKNKASKINWANIPDIYFSPKFRATFHKIFQKSIIILIIFAFTKILGLMIAGGPDYKKLTKTNYLSFDESKKLQARDIEEIKNSNLFKTTQVASGPSTKEKVIISDKICTKANIKSQSPVKLINTIVLQDSVKSIASVQVRSGSDGLQSIREGEVLPGNIKVDKIEGFKLIVKNLSTGECESIENTGFQEKYGKQHKVEVLSPKASKEYKKTLKKLSGIETDGNNFKIDKKFLQEKLKDLSSLLTQARQITMRNPDGTLSFKIVEIEPGSVFDYLGITNGDIISEINGEPIREINDVMNLFGKIGNIPSLNLTLQRDGEKTTQSYNIK